MLFSLLDITMSSQRKVPEVISPDVNLWSENVNGPATFQNKRDHTVHHHLRKRQTQSGKHTVHHMITLFLGPQSKPDVSIIFSVCE